MSDHWVERTVRMLKQAVEDKRRAENLELLRAQKLAAYASSLWNDLLKAMKKAAGEFNAHFPGDKLKQIEIEDALNTVTIKRCRIELEVVFDTGTNRVGYVLSRQQPERDVPIKDGRVPLGFNGEGEVMFIADGRAVSVQRLAEQFLEMVI